MVTIPRGRWQSPTALGRGTTSIRSFGEDDRQDVFDLYGEVFGPEALRRFERRWSWQFFSNPATRLSPAQMWVAEGGGEVLGFLASFPQRMKILYEERVIYHDCDLIVAHHARRRGIGQQLVEAYDRFTNPLSNCLAYAPANGRIRRRRGYRPLHVVPRSFRPYDAVSILRYLADSGRLPSILTARGFRRPLALLGWTLNGAIAVANFLKRPRRAKAYVTEKVRNVGEEFDELWHRLSPSFPVLTVRDRAFVQWRFMEDPVFDHQILAARDVRGCLCGYLVVRVSDRSGLIDGKIMDCFCPPESPEIVGALVRAALEYFERRGVDFVYCLGLDPRIRRNVGRYLYVAPSRLDRPAWFLWKGDVELKGVVYDALNWHLSYADSDIGFAP